MGTATDHRGVPPKRGCDGPRSTEHQVSRKAERIWVLEVARSESLGVVGEPGLSLAAIDPALGEGAD
jgi:hypothetical protein